MTEELSSTVRRQADLPITGAEPLRGAGDNETGNEPIGNTSQYGAGWPASDPPGAGTTMMDAFASLNAATTDSSVTESLASLRGLPTT